VRWEKSDLEQLVQSKDRPAYLVLVSLVNVESSGQAVKLYLYSGLAFLKQGGCSLFTDKLLDFLKTFPVYYLQRALRKVVLGLSDTSLAS
jgi:hypothetical protein